MKLNGIKGEPPIDFNSRANLFGSGVNEGDETDFQLNQTRAERVTDIIKFGVPGVVAGFADTVLNSIGVVEDDDVENFIKTVLPEFGDFYARDKVPLQTIADLTGLFIPGMIAIKALRGASVLGKLINGGKKSALLDSVFLRSGRFERTLQAVRNTDRFLAKRLVEEPELDSFRRLLAQRAQSTRISDVVKENIAFEAGVFATMNDSQTLYPDEFSTAELIALNASFPAIFAIGSFFRTKRLLRASIADASPLAEAARNPAGLPQPLSRNATDILDGSHGDAVTVLSHTRIELEAILQKTIEKEQVTTIGGQGVSFELKKTGLTNEIAAIDSEIDTLIDKLAESSPFSFTKKTNLTQQEKKTVRNILQQDENALLGTESLDFVPNNLKDKREILALRTKDIAKTQEELDITLISLASNELKESAEPALIQLADTLNLRLKKLKASELFVVDPAGAFVPLRDYKLTSRNASALELIPIKKTQLAQGGVEVIAKSESPLGTRVTKLSVTDDFLLILPRLEPGEVKISNINVTKVLKTRGEESAPENFKEILRDMGTDWHVLTQSRVGSANRGFEVFKTLPKDIQDALKAWTSGAKISPIREWFANNDPRAIQLINAFEPMRQRLREIADADGTIPLLRGEKIAETLNPTNDVVSMTSSAAIARQFGIGNGSNIIVRRVHPDDVIVIIGGLGQEFEYIVKGNLNRVITPTQVKSSFEAFDLEQRSAAFAGLQRAIKQFKPGQTKINLSSDDHFTRFDSVIELHRKFGNTILDDVTLPKGINTIEDLEFASVSRKFEDFIRMQTVVESGKTGLLKIPEEQALNHLNIVQLLNLPGTNNGDLPALFKVFLDLHVAQGETNLKQAIGTLDNLKRAVQEVETIPELLPFKRDGVKLMGGQLSHPEDSLPVFVTKRSVSDEQYGRDNLVAAVTNERARVMSILSTASSKGGGLVENIMGAIVSRPELFKSAKRVNTLTEGQQRGTQAISQRSFAIGENPALNSAHNLVLNTAKMHKQGVEAVFKPFIPLFNKLKAPGQKGDLANANLYIHARRQGWDIPEEITPLSGNISNLAGFVLENTERNQSKFLKMFGRAMEEGDLMPVGGTGVTGKFLNYQPLALTPLAVEAAFAFNTISGQLLANKNVLRVAMGRGEITKRAMHVVPKSFVDGNLVFILDDAGEVISTVSGRTIAEARTKARTEISLRGGGGRVVDQESVERYFDLQDKAFMDMLDFTDTAIQTGAITGKQIGIIVDEGQNSLNSTIQAYQRQFESILTQTRAVVFEPEIAFALKRLNAVNPTKAKTKLSIWNQYISILLDRPSINGEQLIGMSNLTVEKYYDNVLSVLADKKAQFFNPPGLAKARSTRREDKVYRELEKSLGDHNPFQSAVDFANKTFNVKPPNSMKRQMSKLTSFTSFMTLRMMEVGHSVLTMTSLAATMPAVISFMKMTDFEKGRGVIGQEEFAARIGAFGTKVDQNTAMFSPVRAMTTATHEWFNDPTFRAAMGRAGDQGYFDQFVSESFKSLTAPAEGYVEGILRRAGDMVSILSDKSERFARAWSFGVGYSIAKRSGLEGDAVRFTMANDFANKVIGDFSSTNRPRIFQGATGMPLGLFMTFMWNYHQRLFSYIENGANRALVTQFATQAAVFGGKTIPGFQQFSETFLTNYDGTANPIDGMNNRFGSEVTEAIMSGAVSNLPKLFGFEDGLSFSTRGDVNPRNFPTLLTLGDTPVFQMFQDFFNLSRETFEMLRTRGGFDDDQMAEIIQSYSTNRFIRNQAALYTGFVTDRRGQPISVNTPSYMDIFRGDVQNEIALIARLVGVRTLNEQSRVEAHSRNRSTDLSRRYRLGELRDVIRSDFRNGNGSQESIEKAFEQYTRFGGSVDHFPRFLMEQFLTSKVDKTSREILKIFNNPQKIDNLMRLMNVL